jgi:low affinity Fe/Cu permease
MTKQIACDLSRAIVFFNKNHVQSFVMKILYTKIENAFEKLVNLALKLYGNSLTFIAASACVIFFLSNPVFYRQNIHDIIRDIMMCVTFLGFFIIQKAFNKYTRVIHLKMNELVSAHGEASNELVNIEQRTEGELKEFAKNYEKKNENDMNADKPSS